MAEPRRPGDSRGLLLASPVLAADFYLKARDDQDHAGRGTDDFDVGLRPVRQHLHASCGAERSSPWPPVGGAPGDTSLNIRPPERSAAVAHRSRGDGDARHLPGDSRPSWSHGAHMDRRGLRSPDLARPRVRSFSQEILPGGSATHSWAHFAPGPSSMKVEPTPACKSKWGSTAPSPSTPERVWHTRESPTATRASSSSARST